MQLILFNKLLQSHSTAELIALAHRLGIDGYDFCVRPGFLVTPENVASQLPTVAREMRAEGLAIPMITGRVDLLSPRDKDVRPLLRAMDRADIRLLKLGYFRFPPSVRLDYAAEIRRARRLLARWETLGREHGVKICYHVHSSTGDFFLGSNAAALLDLIDGFDPRHIGGYLDAGHLAIEGEPFGFAAAVARKYLAVVGLKDVRRVPRPGAGGPELRWEPAGKGVVDWAAVSTTCREMRFTGPLTIHAEFVAKDRAAFLRQLAREARFFRQRFPR